MNIVEIAQVTGIVSIFLLFCIKFYIAINDKLFYKSGRIAILWTTVYVFFLFLVRVVSFFGGATMDQLRILSGFSSLVPLIAVVAHLWVTRTVDTSAHEDYVNTKPRIKKGDL
jgi:hypothetical protein